LEQAIRDGRPLWLDWPDDANAQDAPTVILPAAVVLGADDGINPPDQARAGRPEPRESDFHMTMPANPHLPR
jgi:hypothetical protein